MRLSRTGTWKAGLVCLDLAALLGDAGADAVDFVADVHTVGDGALVRVFGDQILVGTKHSACGLEGVAVRPDDRGVEIFQHLPPEPVETLFNSGAVGIRLVTM